MERFLVPMVYNTALSIYISHQLHAFIHKPSWVNLAASLSLLLLSRNRHGDKNKWGQSTLNISMSENL